nr:unnamed protein product [Spirometra erinaceieuropaei]
MNGRGFRRPASSSIITATTSATVPIPTTGENTRDALQSVPTDAVAAAAGTTTNPTTILPSTSTADSIPTCPHCVHTFTSHIGPANPSY